MSDFKLTPAREKELEKIAKDLPDKSFKDLYGKNWKSVKIATAMNILKKKYGYKTEETMKTFKQIRERYRGKYPPALVAAAVKIALDMGGNMTGAYKKIERMKKGLGDDPIVSDALRKANEGVQKEGTIKEGTWHIPETIEELRMLVALLSRPRFAKNANDVRKLTQVIPIGDDALYDILDSYMYEPGGTLEVDRPLKKATGTFKNGPVNMSIIIGNTLVQERWISGKPKGKAFHMTHHFFGPIFGDDNPENFKDLPYDLKPEKDFQQAEFSPEEKEKHMKEKNLLKRKSGNVRRGKMVRLPI